MKIIEEDQDLELLNRMVTRNRPPADEETIRETQGDAAWPRLPFFLVYGLIIVTFACFTAIMISIHKETPFSIPHFAFFDEGLLHGHLYLNQKPPDISDYTFYKGHWYLAFPPLPGLLMLPIVFIFHLRYASIYNLIFTVVMSLFNVGLMFWVLQRFARYRAINISLATASTLVLLFALGTDYLFATLQGSIWYTEHIVATTFLLLYIIEVLGKRRAVLAGLFLGLAFYSRTTTVLTFPFFVFLGWFAWRHDPKRFLKQMALFGGTLAIFVALFLCYNKLRFDSFFDFGYNNMHVNIKLASNLHTYGQFSLHFLRTDIRYLFLEPPHLIKTFPFVTFNTNGTSIFLTTPALFFTFLAFRNPKNRRLALALLVSCLLTLIPLLLYFNTGWKQVGSRFSLDFMPFALLLAFLAMRSELKWSERLIIGLSILITVWSCYVYIFFKPTS